ncbi:hypothetical protein [Pengzhenrongella frigida]|uniref:Uncharacterized protein n=1 Tax=Pengzhenrongella frigida TaxID=1259133 RepID=A0A4Q5MW60_9MICO|nr:hypothetical protein [Cellulomonas sp. HLT2-17]RYV49818.1 hypothetical protein EUA98_16790 [Cellulomonas sp. HLT2-17]
MARSRSIRKSLRVGGFLGAAGLTAVLAGVAVSGTGAYFTDSEAGSLTATAGHINLSVDTSTLALGDVMPGADQTASINYSLDVSGTSDVWLTFDPTDERFLAFSGAANNPLYPAGGLGRYGHFDVSTKASGRLFQSYNLAHVPAADLATATPCPVTVDGRGGSGEEITGEKDTNPYCGVPTAIKLASGLADNATGTINLTFGLTGLASGGQDATWADVPFTIVATQAGIRPDALDF